MQLMQDVLREYLDDFVVSFIDDILIYSKTLIDHERHVREVLIRYVKISCMQKK